LSEISSKCGFFFRFWSGLLTISFYRRPVRLQSTQKKVKDRNRTGLSSTNREGRRLRTPKGGCKEGNIREGRQVRSNPIVPATVSDTSTSNGGTPTMTNTDTDQQQQGPPLCPPCPTLSTRALLASLLPPLYGAPVRRMVSNSSSLCSRGFLWVKGRG
jgi:hypothetical protein